MLITTKTPERLTLEGIFENWNGDEYDSYDWDEFDASAGNEMI